MKNRLVHLAFVMSLGIASSLSASFACHADSLTSSASSTGSALVGSLSDSIHGSSNSSSGDRKVADGDYRILEVAAMPDHPDMLRMRMQIQAPRANDDTGMFFLDLPQRAIGAQAFKAGDVVSVHNRPYGLEFARAQTREPFFLVLSDEWRSDLDAHAVTF